jgi:hypothetical protein
MKQGFVIAADGFQVRFEDRANGVMMEVEFPFDKLSLVARYRDKGVILRHRLSAPQIKGLDDWLLDR